MYYNNYKINFSDEKEYNLQLLYNYSKTDNFNFNIGLIYREYLNKEYIGVLKFGKVF